MTTLGLVLRVVPLLFACCAGISPLLCGDKRGAGAMKKGETVTPTPIFVLSEAQVQVFATKPAAG